ncbi:hypothetical protein B0A75_11310 [Flavobacterium oncorhynchi]|uniref:Uncharacterized protein n=1 Tax=Flavobacterium oncorhynchi TaxID=728056 RepID=A0A226I100_9FLAO|nr:hypothetical protein [Flavobacterium oncorhynchi]OXA99391.1 hypothetical protein B0A75_11310 [Flavobacterium oncorhynchi]
MSWGTTDQKGELAKMGLEAGIDFFKSMTADSQRLKDEAKENIKNISDDELKKILEINEEYVTRVNNLLYDTELGCKFKKTEEIFLMIVEIIMLDLEFDYQETISNFTKAIDTEEFINSHKLSLEKRENRLNEEYQKELKEYEIEMTEYRKEMEQYKSKNFFSKIFAEEPLEPFAPEKRK